MRVVAAVVLSLAVSARAEPIEQGLSWLRSQQGPDGTLGAARGEETLVATTEAVATWCAVGLHTQPETLAALAALGTWPERPDTELRLRRHVALTGSAWDFSVTDFSGHAEGFDAEEPWLQAWSLLSASPAGAGWTSRAVALVGALDPQGCVSRADNGASTEVTSMVLLAVRRRSDVPVLHVARGALVSCLVGQQGAGGDFGGAAATASALLALQSVPGVPATTLSAARSALLSMQASDGSWGSVRATALAVRALGAASPDWEARVEFGRALVSVNAGTVLQGQAVSARAQFRNAAAFSAPPVLVRFRLMQGPTVVVVREEWLPALAPGQLVEVGASLPTDGLAGQYVIEAEANAQRLLPELDSTNNRATGAVSVLMATDLAVTSESIKFQADSPTTAKLLVTVQNRGSALATPATVSAWAFTPRTGRPLGSFQVPAGTPQGQWFTGELIFTTTDLTGATPIHALVDPDGLIAEYDENNNGTARYFENGVQNLTELVAEGSVVTTPSPPIAGTPFTLRAQVANFGQWSVHSVVVSFVHDGTADDYRRARCHHFFHC